MHSNDLESAINAIINAINSSRYEKLLHLSCVDIKINLFDYDELIQSVKYDCMFDSFTRENLHIYGNDDCYCADYEFSVLGIPTGLLLLLKVRWNKGKISIIVEGLDVD